MNSNRTSVYVDSFAHANPIPAACRIGNLVFSGIITGRDPETRELAESLELQCKLMFENLRAIAGAAGASTSDIARITIWLKDRADREAVNLEWIAMFPDSEDRPARQSHTEELDGGLLVTCEFIAVVAGD